MTSRAIVDSVIKIAHTKRVGHAGTLDPMARGVLIVGIEKATRLLEYVQRLPKTYLADITLGKTSTSDDGEGEISDHLVDVVPSLQEVQFALTNFSGTFSQIPPKYSALKIGGKRAYDLARGQQTFELAPRTVTVYSIDVVAYEFPTVQLKIECASGTYVRSIARDLGEALGVGGLLSALQRTAIGPFTVEKGIDTAEFRYSDLATYGMELTKGVCGLIPLQLDGTQSTRFILGQKIFLERGPRDTGECGVTDEYGRFLGIGYYDTMSRRLKPDKLGFVPRPTNPQLS